MHSVLHFGLHLLTREKLRLNTFWTAGTAYNSDALKVASRSSFVYAGKIKVRYFLNSWYSLQFRCIKCYCPQLCKCILPTFSPQYPCHWNIPRRRMLINFRFITSAIAIPLLGLAAVDRGPYFAHTSSASLAYCWCMAGHIFRGGGAGRETALLCIFYTKP
jgi:hypothetical protein